MAYRATGRRQSEPIAEELKVLLVEDSRTYALALSRRLEAELQLPIVVCQSLNELHEVVTEDRAAFTLAVVDLNLPDAPRGEAIDFTVQRRIPTIVHTASFDLETRNRIMERDVIDYVPKDSAFTLETVVATARRALSNRQTRILVVDDTAATRKLLTHMLKVQQYQVIEAESGDEALALIQDNPDIRLVVSDYYMPEMDGYELTRRIRRQFASDRLRLIGVSSSSDRMVSVGFLKAGANDFISMPFIPEELQCRIASNVETLEQIEQLHNLASRDALTGLFNRRYFFESAEKLIAEARAKNLPSAIAILDIDDFKHLNDSHGHDFGDQALAKVARYLAQSVEGAGHLLARIGGEEFAILFPGLNTKAALRLSDHIRLDLSHETLLVDDQQITLTVSIGVAEISGQGSLDQYLIAADRALYAAKHEGRNCVRVAA
ncbi:MULTISPECIES: diguanylate cyclase [unclassified Bosea (in: a-proteobacteria)]|uniref:diguanylate cyclase n=1 Tax=unclassified Bosea (in: a-proteobacteria) TaxID=2653178 RepID=UPI000F74DE6F|nr:MULTISPECIES: diguanylate cyclase [unclassified Bosea (in: a-proteobacteria)]AZO78941.1 diguanylate cyclase response regulator [Bosea sp. Tri-49]RXT27672.1 diguanylate cyclase response regulator [Bosea sp. Tri-39]RXT35623.1 diguanylate cyclase response regulator [Bosea sp. Tri-54]